MRWLPRQVAAIAGVLAGLATAAAAQECAPGNLVPDAMVTGTSVQGFPRTIADQFVPAEGTRWDAASAVVLSGPAAALVVDLAAVVPVNAFMIQADGDDAYAVEGSRDGVAYEPLWVAPVAAGDGLRFRSARIDPVRTRYLRIRAADGDGRHAVSEFVAVCAPPGASILHAAGWEPKPGGWLQPRLVQAVKLVVALAAACLFLWMLVARTVLRRGAGGMTRDAALAALGAVGLACWWNLGSFHVGAYLHHEELFHYFMGSKYLPELGYDGLYAAVAAADVDAGFGEWVRRRSSRDLRTNELVGGDAILPRAAEVRRAFSAERWGQFERDLGWFRTRLPPRRWSVVLQDHGYNATPAWGMVARLLTAGLPASDAGMLALALIDPVLLAATWALLAAAFGWRAAAVAAIWWGTNLPAGYTWTGGGFLRQDWLFATAAGVVLARVGRWAGAGAALGWGALLRVYPLFLAAGLGVAALGSMLRRRSRSLERSHTRFAVGFLWALALGMALSAFADPRGLGSWADFAEASRVDMTSTGQNQIGLSAVISFDRERTLRRLAEAVGPESAANVWQEEKSRSRQAHRWLKAAALGAFALLLLRRTRNAEGWEALVLGLGFLPLATLFSSYYAAVFLFYGLLWVHRGEAAGLPVAALAAWTQGARLVWGPGFLEETFFGISAGVLVAVAVLTAWRGPAGQEALRPAGEGGQASPPLT